MRNKVQRGNWIGLALAVLITLIATPWAQGQTYSVLYNFCPGTPSCVDGDEPFAGLVQATNGDLYGTTALASLPPGDNGYGNVFKITPGGTETNLYSFDINDGGGAYPYASLLQATNGNLYGTTYMGGDGGGNGDGTIFKITPAGVFTNIYTFGSGGNDITGAWPTGALIQASDGNLYGTTQNGGANVSYGTIFRITPGGTFTSLYSFNETDGMQPDAGLVQAANGDLYGTTEFGGVNVNCDGSGCGTIFKITLGGVLTTLYSFCAQPACADGSMPTGALIQDTNGNLYGTTLDGGSGGGTMFRITPAGVFTSLYNFCPNIGCTAGPGTLVQGTDGNLYGLAGGGTYGRGTIFKITTGGTLTTLYSFNSQGGDGQYPSGGLIRDTNGNLYGTTKQGGTNGGGIVFKLSLGLKPFVSTNPTSGKAKSAVTILGNKLTGATSVKFNGKPATFKVVSATEITTTVPTGATTGKVVVKTPTATLTSNVNFRVP